MTSETCAYSLGMVWSGAILRRALGENQIVSSFDCDDEASIK